MADVTEAIAKDALAFALAKHAGQTDKLGHDYGAHIRHVGDSVAHFGETFAAVGYLHDVVEDCDVSLVQITARFGAKIAAGVDAMTRRAGEDYAETYLPRLMSNKLARVVKFADSRHNFGKIHLLDDSEMRAKLTAKYSNVFALLCMADGEFHSWGPAPDLEFRAGQWRPIDR